MRGREGAKVDEAPAPVNAEQAVIDGEIVVLDESGRPSFQALQHRAEHPKHSVVYYAFGYYEGRCEARRMSFKDAGCCCACEVIQRLATDLRTAFSDMK